MSLLLQPVADINISGGDVVPSNEISYTSPVYDLGGLRGRSSGVER